MALASRQEENRVEWLTWLVAVLKLPTPWDITLDSPGPLRLVGLYRFSVSSGDLCALSPFFVVDEKALTPKGAVPAIYSMLKELEEAKREAKRVRDFDAGLDEMFNGWSKYY